MHRRAALTFALPVLVASCGGSPAAGLRAGSGAPPPKPTAPASVPAPAPAPSVAAEPPAPPPPPAPAPPPKPMLATKQFTTFIWEKPRYGSAQIGFFRAGSKIVRAEAPVDAKDKDLQPCGGTWWKVEPAGYVCEGRDGVTRDLDDPTVVAAAKYPPRSEPLPYGYGMAVGAHLYARVPTEKEQREYEGDVALWRKQRAEQRAKLPPEKRPPELALPVAPPPSFLDNHAQAPPVLPYLGANKTYRAGWAYHGVRLAFLAAFDVPFGEGTRPFYLTTEHLVVPADRVVAAQASEFRGVELSGAESLPMVWIRLASDVVPAHVYKLNGDALTKTDVVLPTKSHWGIAKDDVVVKGARYHELREPPRGLSAEPGTRFLLRPGEATRLDPATSLPNGVQAGETWIEVTLSKQTLVIYEGLTPRFATLVSTGAGGKNHNTPVGNYRVYQKHISSRMSAEARPPEKEGEPGEHAYRFDDVPWVQYIVGGIALHAAFWHDGFGLPRSHGCVNLSPADAKTVFARTLPAIPAGWHGIMPGHAGMPLGTMVAIRG